MAEPNPTGLVDASTLGARIRELRVARGLTQSALASDRFTKEYMSQIERGKTRPSERTLDWLAERLGVDRSFLETGLVAAERARIESILSRAEAATEAHDSATSLELVSELETPTVELRFRALLVHSWALMETGDVRSALDVLESARVLAEVQPFGDLDRAEVLYRFGVYRYKLASVPTAIASLAEALALAERSELPCDRLRVSILAWRARCYRRQRDWEAAREDIERALELAEGLTDRSAMAHIFFQASLVAEREGQWIRSRTYAERAKALYEEVADRRSVGRLLNNLGGLTYLLGRPQQAVDYLNKAFATALDIGSDVDAAQAISSLAQVHLRTGSVELAEEQALKALELLAGRVDYLDEIGNAELVLGRSLLEQGRLAEAAAAFGQADATFEQLASQSHRAAVWIAQGDLATAKGDDREAARLYRRAAEALQDFRF